MQAVPWLGASATQGETGKHRRGAILENTKKRMLACIHGSGSAGSLSLTKEGDGKQSFGTCSPLQASRDLLLFSRFRYGALEPCFFVSSLYKYTIPTRRERRRRVELREELRCAVTGGVDDKYHGAGSAFSMTDRVWGNVATAGSDGNREWAGNKASMGLGKRDMH